MPYCPNCGAPLDDGAKFCGSCGSSVSEYGSAASSYEPAAPGYQPPIQDFPPIQNGYQTPAGQTYAPRSAVEPYNTTGLWIWSIITILLSLIPGAIAISMVSKINKCATAEEQKKKIKNAKIWCIVGTVIGVLVLIGQMNQ